MNKEDRIIDCVKSNRETIPSYRILDNPFLSIDGIPYWGNYTKRKHEKSRNK